MSTESYASWVPQKFILICQPLIEIQRYYQEHPEKYSTWKNKWVAIDLQSKDVVHATNTEHDTLKWVAEIPKQYFVAQVGAKQEVIYPPRMPQAVIETQNYYQEHTEKYSDWKNKWVEIDLQSKDVIHATDTKHDT